MQKTTNRFNNVKIKNLFLKEISKILLEIISILLNIGEKYEIEILKIFIHSVRLEIHASFLGLI